MSWEVEYTDEFGDWWNELSEAEQESVDASVRLLEERGPNLGFPHSSGINGSRHGHMRELRTQHDGRPLRTLYAFDPRRAAILLIGGDKTGNARWYDIHVPIADRLYDEQVRVLATGTPLDHVFGDEMIAAAVLDRVLHHSHVLVIQGDSFRLKQKKRAGLLGSTKNNH